MRRSDALRRWDAALLTATMNQGYIDALGVGAHRGLVMIYRADLDKWTTERDRLYALLTPADKATADRIKVTTP